MNLQDILAFLQPKPNWTLPGQEGGSWNLPSGGVAAPVPLPPPRPWQDPPAEAGPGLGALLSSLFQGQRDWTVPSGGVAPPALPPPVPWQDPPQAALVPEPAGGAGLGALLSGLLPQPGNGPMWDPLTGRTPPDPNAKPPAPLSPEQLLQASFGATSEMPGVPTAPVAPTAASGVKFGLPEMPAAGRTQTFTVGPQGAAPDPMQAAMSLIRSKEGFIEKPKWDVNALRVGYGTDTITGPDGTVRPVKKGDTVTREDAERDLERRTGEFMGSVRTSVGEDAFKKLNPNQVAALTSVTYNYGTLPASVATAVKSGDPEAIAKSIEGLAGHNEGVNASRRMHEAAIARGAAMTGAQAGMPGVPNITAPQLPIPGATTPLQGLDPKAFDRFNTLAVTRPPPMDTSDRITTVLANMAANAAGGKNFADVLLGAGAGASAGAAKNIAQERGEAKEFANENFDLQKLLAGVDVQKAEAAQQGANFKISAGNQDNQLLQQVKTEQAKLDAAAKNKVAEIQNEVDWKKWQLFQPQIKADKDGVTVIERTPEGGMKVTVQKGNEMDALADRIKDAGAAFGKDSASVDMLRYAGLARQGEPFVRRQIMRDMVDRNLVRGAVGEDQFKKLEKEAEKGLDQSLRGKPEEWDSQKKQRILDILWSQKLPDETWLPYMLKQGNFGAAMLARPNG